MPDTCSGIVPNFTFTFNSLTPSLHNTQQRIFLRSWINNFIQLLNIF